MSEETVIEEVTERRPIYPLDSVRRDLISEYWAWYLAPFKKPRVTAECEAWILGETRKAPTAGKLMAWQRALADAPTIKATAASALTRKPAAIAAERESMRRRGWVICQRIEGDLGDAENPLNMWDPTIKGVDRYYGCEEIVAELKRRLPWAIKQIEARIAVTERNMERRGMPADQIAYAETTLGLYQEALDRIRSDSVPYAEELFAFFKRYQRVMLEAKLDVRMKEQAAIQGRILENIQAEQSALASVREEVGV